MTCLRLIAMIGILLLMADCTHANDATTPVVTKATVEINGKTAFPSNGTIAGVWFFHDSELGDASPQLLLTGFAEPTPKYRFVAVLNPGDRIVIRPGGADQEPLVFEAEGTPLICSGFHNNTMLDPVRRPWSFGPTECSPNFKPVIEAALIEHDWRLQDGIDTPQESRTYEQAVVKMIAQMGPLFKDLADSDVLVGDLRDRFESLKISGSSDDMRWLDLHHLRRELVLRNPLFNTGPLMFAKHVPSTMSHQLTQTYGYTARPGGGVFVLDMPGQSMQVRSLTDKQLPMGNFAHPEVRFDGKKIYFAYCEVAEAPQRWRDPEAMNRWYHLYEMNADGTGLRQLTDGEFDDFNPTCLPDGNLAFISTRRGGYHRCGGGPCYVYTLATMNPNVDTPTDPWDKPRPISFHETNEWDPAVLNDGRVIYTRWDYVDRDAVFYQQLWSTRQDGTNVRIYYGNNTFVPCGVWEARAIPGSSKVMATAAAHHAMTAGSIILLDTSLGVDGSEPITRLTPDARFPEGETLLAAAIGMPAPSDFDSPIPFHWDAVNRPDRPADRLLEPTEQERRFVGHCYKAAWPLSERYFIVSYSYDRLRGEIGPNIPNMFGIYFMDAFGNKELIYRDPNISSVWAKPLAAREVPPVINSGLDKLASNANTGTFAMQNVYESWPQLPEGDENRITALRLVQVLPKTTPNANDPMVGAAFASPGQQVLGTVPVEADGSAYFDVPANTPMMFQALDKNGRAVQTMRSLTYLQPGENMSCVGCHEHRMQTSIPNHQATAMQRAPSQITPGPDGSKPLSYPILVQPVLDRYCISCHTEIAADENGGIVLTGAPEGHYTRSYNALVSRVAWTAWGLPEGNHEPMTEPDRFGARASALVKLLEEGHYDVKLSTDDWNRINTWIDANALFYGTFKPEDQQRQQCGERIEGPDLE